MINVYARRYDDDVERFIGSFEVSDLADLIDALETWGIDLVDGPVVAQGRFVTEGVNAHFEISVAPRPWSDDATDSSSALGAVVATESRLTRPSPEDEAGAARGEGSIGTAGQPHNDRFLTPPP